jgi:glycerol-3-phosphate acyltransferase PlsY
MLLYALGVVQAYFIGAIPFGFLLVKSLKGIDIRAVGSGNIGATNVARAAGKKVGALAFLLDVAKGFVAATWIPFAVHAIATEHYSYPGAWGVAQAAVAGRGFTDLRIVCGLAAIAGHIWTVFLSFKGGKGVATSLGVLLGIAPWPTLAALAAWAIVTGLSGYVSLGSIMASLFLPVSVALFDWGHIGENAHLLVFTIIIGVLVTVRHRENIRRLMAGTESRVSFLGKKHEV